MVVVENLRKTAIACATVADHLNAQNNEHPHTYKVCTEGIPGKQTFRFKTVIVVDGQQIEVSAKSL